MTRESLGPTGSRVPAQPSAAQNSRWWLWGALAVAFLRVLPALRFPIGRDEATYCVIAQGLLRGQVLYRDLWDNKPPGIFYVYTLIVKLFGPVMWSVGIVEIIWLLAVSVCIFCFAKRYLGAPAAAIAVVSNALWHCSWGYIHAAQPDTFASLFVFLAFFLLSSQPARTWWGNVSAGLLCGAAFWLKYNVAPLFPVLAFLPYLDFSGLDMQPRQVTLAISWRTWWARTLLVAAGFLLAILGVLLHFWAIGALPAFREVQFEVLPRYGSMFLERIHNYPLFAITLTHLHLGVWTEVAFAVALVIAWSRRELRLIAPVIIMALAAFISTAAQVRFSSYAFETCYPFFAMLWGYVIFQGYEGFQYLRGFFRRHGWRLAGALLWLILAQVIYFPLPDAAYGIGQEYQGLGDWVRDPQRSYENYPFPYPLDKLHDQLAVIKYLKYNSTAGDAVFVWGVAPLINFLAQRPSPSRFVSNFALISPWGPVRWRQELIWELNRKPPRFIVVARHDSIPFVSLTYDDSAQSLAKFPALVAFIESHYAPIENLEDFELSELKIP